MLLLVSLAVLYMLRACQGKNLVSLSLVMKSNPMGRLEKKGEMVILQYADDAILLLENNIE
jgi:hypothetical protein